MNTYNLMFVQKLECLSAEKFWMSKIGFRLLALDSSNDSYFLSKMESFQKAHSSITSVLCW